MTHSTLSSSSRNWLYDVFPSFSGEDIRQTFLSHFLKELDRKLIISFKDNEIQRSQSLGPELTSAIRGSRIAVVIFSKTYASSSWCLDELLEIVGCKLRKGQFVIPIFYGVNPSHVRKQNGDFGKVFEKTCQNRTEDEQNQWRTALTDVANMLGFHSSNWDNEAKMIEEIVNDVLVKLNLTPSKGFEEFVGIEDHMTEMSSLMRLESEEVRMVGIWGSSGIGKTTIARALFSRLSPQFQCSVFIDRAFVSKCRRNYHKANPDDNNMKLHLQGAFMYEIYGKRDIKIDHIGAMGERLNQHKLLIVLDDLDDQVVLDALAGRIQWFGCGTRIIAITKDKHLLRAHGITCVYGVGLPSEKQALQMFCRSAFRQDSPPDGGYLGLASEVVKRAGNLPLGINILGSYLRGRNKEDWIDMLPRLCNRLNRNVGETLRVSYDGLGNENDKAIFRHLACLFNGEEIDYIKLILADIDLDVNIGLKNLVDKALIHVRWDSVQMHCLVQEMGKEIVCSQSSEPGEREFLWEPKDICDVLEDNTGTKRVLGISLDMSRIDELYIHKKAFKKMRNLFFLKIYKKPYKEVIWHIPKSFDYFPPKLKVLSWIGYPLRSLPSNFCPQHLVKLKMQKSKIEKLWEGVHTLTSLKRMDLSGSKYLKEIPDLSMATKLEKLLLRRCSSLMKITSSIRHLHKLFVLDMSRCTRLEGLPSGINLKSLDRLYLGGCSRLRSFPNISSNISCLDLSRTMIEEFPSCLHLRNLKILQMKEIESQKLWGGVQPLTCLTEIDFSGSKKLKELPNLSLAISLEWMNLRGCSSLVELPSSSIENLNKMTSLSMEACTKLEMLPTNINLESLDYLNLGGCSSLRIFPEISRNVSLLVLDQTAIEDVPWSILNFSRLKCLRMRECKKTIHLPFRIMKQLKEVDFSNTVCSYKLTIYDVNYHQWTSELRRRTTSPSKTMSVSLVHLPQHLLAPTLISRIELLNLSRLSSTKTPQLTDSIEIPEYEEVLLHKIDLNPIRGLLTSVHDTASSAAGTISSRLPLKISLPDDNAQSWLLTTYLEKDLQISRADGGSVFELINKGDQSHKARVLLYSRNVGSNPKSFIQANLEDE